eukprot:5644264-Amphidinium_carterae.2
MLSPVLTPVGLTNDVCRGGLLTSAGEPAMDLERVLELPGVVPGGELLEEVVGGKIEEGGGRVWWRDKGGAWQAFKVEAGQVSV